MYCLLHIHPEHEPVSDIWHALLDAFQESIYICLLVLLMMTLIEIFNVTTHGKLFQGLEKHRFGQIIVSAALGLLPGCLGGFAGVSLYSHRMIGFGALAALLITTTGDEAFLMWAEFPKTAAIIISGLFLFGIIVGCGIDLLLRTMQKRGRLIEIGADRKNTDNFELHACDCEAESDDRISGQDYGHEGLHHKHGHHHHEHGHHHTQTDNGQMGWQLHVWHFIRMHIWKHVIKRHLPVIFAWTFGVLAVFGVISMYIDLETWIRGNTWLMVVLAVAIGMIPESGPHMIFVTMFAHGILPLPVLLASCISQDGHSCLPLLAENKQSFFIAKLIKAVLALIVGFGAMAI